MDCIIVSNRLPVHCDNDDKIFQPSAGGLVSAIKGLRIEDYRFSWWGIMDTEVDDVTLPSDPFPCHAIYVEKSLYDSYYNGFCNDVLWPLFHYEHSRIKYSTKAWNAYIKTNEIVAKNLIQEAKPNSTVWIHDFHFLLLPKLLKEKRPDLKIGFFLHIPFPSSEVYRQLPTRLELLEGVLSADLIGFHDLSYMNHFQMSVRRLMGIESEMMKIEFHNHTTHLGIFPISIESKQLKERSYSDETQNEVQKLLEEKDSRTWILGVDRLDYIKGLILKLQTFQRLLRKYPKQAKNKIQLRQIVIPSRTGVKEYQQLKEKIDQLVGSINGEFGEIGYVPVLYQFSSVDEPTLLALYQTADAIWINSRRDGMNLVCLEYVAAQNLNRPGVVLLSEFTGAHSTLSYAHSINPWDVDGTAERIITALKTPFKTRQHHIEVMSDFLRTYTSSDWARNFLETLSNAQSEIINKSELVRFSFFKEHISDNPFIFLDYDGTMVPIREKPELAIPDSELITILSKLSLKTTQPLCVVSGRSVEFFEHHFLQKNIHIPIAANHGGHFYNPELRTWTSMVHAESSATHESIRNLLNIYTARTPGSFIEEKDFGIAWHYRNAPSDFSDFVAKKLLIELQGSLAGSPLHVLSGKKVIEIKYREANKGYFVDWYLKQFGSAEQKVFAIGDDETDEDMFHTLNHYSKDAITVKVGLEKTSARFRINDLTTIRDFLKLLAT